MENKNDEIKTINNRNPQGILTARRKKDESNDQKVIKRLGDVLTNNKTEDSIQSNAEEERLVHN